ncbi:MAG: peptide chain release factor 1 [Caldilineaceae bacterium]|nr:peptide chain release factor 1 [Caldilineaceae bacterium]
MELTEQLSKVEERYGELDRLMADPDVLADYVRVQELAQERSGLEELVGAFRRYQDLQLQLADSRELLEESDDPELAELAELEIVELAGEVSGLEDSLRRMLLPKDRNDDKNVIVEIRAGAGGDEAGIFAADLLRMYTRWADDHRFKAEIMSVSETGVGGIKEAILEVRGKGAYSRMKYESGVHRVQRVPTTESQGRIHTSTATVAVLPEAEDVEIEIAPNEIKVDVFRSSGPGGQSVNTTDSAVRLTHLPTGIVISCQDEKSQLQNRLKAVRILKAKLYDIEMQKQTEDMGAARRSQVGSGDRSEKIRTYNFPQGRVTDHRINKTLFQLEQVLNGELDEFIEDLAAFDQAQQLQAMGEEE